jgi:FtsZ-binding cell division protein ZapB
VPAQQLHFLKESNDECDHGQNDENMDKAAEDLKSQPARWEDKARGVNASGSPPVRSKEK